MDGVTEQANKWNILLNMDYEGIDCYSVFKRKRNVFVWGEHFHGVTNVWGHPCITQTLTLLPKQLSHAKAIAQASKVSKKTRNYSKTQRQAVSRQI